MRFENRIKICAPTTPLSARLSRPQLWQGLVARAEQPELFVYGLEYMKVLARGTNWLERELCLPGGLLVRDRVLKQPKGDRAFVELLLAAREVGLEALQVACELTLDGGVITAAVVMNELRRITAPPRPNAISLPDQLRLQVEPLADCSRYDRLRGGQYVH